MSSSRKRGPFEGEKAVSVGISDEQSDLLRRAISGETLSESDQALLSGLLGKSSEETKSPRQSGEKYLHKLSHYAEIYGQAERTLKRWTSKGRSVIPPDLPPLDDPTEMPAWFSRHHKHRVPEYLLTLAAGEKDVQVPPVVSGESSQPTYRAPSVLPSGIGYEAELQRVREEAQKAAGILADAEKSRVSSEILAAQRQYDRALKLLREYERDAPKILAGMGNLVDRNLVEQLIIQKNSVIKSELENLVHRVHARVDAESDFVKKTGIWIEELHRVFRGLEASGFGDQAAFALEAA